MTGQEKLICLGAVLIFLGLQMKGILSFASDIQGGTEIRVSWTPPILRITGEPMADSEIGHYDFFCWPEGEPQDSRLLGSVENTGNTNTAILQDHILKFVGTCTLTGCDFFPRALVIGINECAVSAVDVGGLASEFSTSIIFDNPPWPNSPFGLSN